MPNTGFKYHSLYVLYSSSFLLKRTMATSNTSSTMDMETVWVPPVITQRILPLGGRAAHAQSGEDDDHRERPGLLPLHPPLCHCPR